MDSHPPPPNPTPSSSNGNNSNNQNNHNHNRDQFLRHLTHLNKLSHKISKPTNRPSEPPAHQPVHPPPPSQPPVYNISKSDFRDVVQQLTGSPSHNTPSHTPSPPTTLHAPKPNSSRLQRIRPPPLAPLSSGFGSGLAPMSPLPPLPTCHAAAESPISSYMRFLHSAVNTSTGLMFPPPENLDNLENVMPPPPSSPLPFGCLPSPCQILSPKLVLPLSPTVSGVPNPK